MNDRALNFLSLMTAIIAALLGLYFLTAPPMMTAIVNQSGDISFPIAYQPMMRLIESDFNGPLLWYFNDVWKCGIIVLGEETSPWHVVALYAVVGVGLVAAVVFPFYRRIQSVRPACAEPNAAPNGGPATQFGNSGVTEGPPSVS